jgi:hypothetical protein
VQFGKSKLFAKNLHCYDQPPATAGGSDAYDRLL